MKNIDIGYDILNSTLDSKSGSISFTIGDSITELTQYSDCEYFQHVGFASLPAKAQPGKDAAQCISIHTPNENVIIGTKDIRSQSIYGNLKPGETTIYAVGPNNVGTSRILLKDNGEVASITSLLQENNKDDGLPIMLQLSSDSSINLINSSYNTIQLNKDGINIVSNGTINFGSKKGFAIIGETLALNSGSVSIGANATTYAPALDLKVMAEIDKLKKMILKVNSAIPSMISDPTVAAQASIPTPPLGSTSIKIAE